MKCNICGREYIALGVHVRHKHQTDPDDYRDEFGILRTTPLVDEELSEIIRALAKNRMKDEDYKSEMTEKCKKNGASRKGKKGYGMTPQGKAALSERNSKNVKYTVTWLINGEEYNSSAIAAKALGIAQSEVVRRCNGYTRRGKNYFPWPGWRAIPA